jgi:hypothetical protein
MDANAYGFFNHVSIGWIIIDNFSWMYLWLVM